MKATSLHTIYEYLIQVHNLKINITYQVTPGTIYKYLLHGNMVIIQKSTSGPWYPDWYTPSEKDGNHPPLRTFWMRLGKTPSYILGVGKGMELHSHFAAKHSKLTIRA